jgi:hypothetical protein
MSGLREDCKETLQPTAGYIISLALIVSSSLLIHDSLVFLKKFFGSYIQIDYKFTARFTSLSFLSSPSLRPVALESVIIPALASCTGWWSRLIHVSFTGYTTNFTHCMSTEEVGGNRLHRTMLCCAVLG